MDKMKIYNKLPIFAQNIACDVEGYRVEKLRYPKDFDRILAHFCSHDKLGLPDVKKAQIKLLRKLLIHCQENVPYYTELFEKIGFNAYNFSDLKQMEELPVLTKADVNRDYDKFLMKGTDESKLLKILTGGTTGASLKLLKSYREEANKWAVWWRYRYRLGITRDMVEARFASNQIVPLEQKRPPYWRKNNPGKVIFFSQYHLNSETVVDYVKELKRQNVTWIHGYASVISNLANLMLEKELRLEVPHITVGAENLYESQRKAIKAAFKTEPYQHYGNTEGAANFSQYPDGKIRIDEDFSYVEFVKKDDKNLVVGTNFYNYIMPFVRYSTGDCAELSDKQDGGFRIISNIIGREGEYVTLRNGTHISAEALDTRIFAYIPRLGGTQIVQNSLDKLDVNIIPLEGFSEADKNLLKGKMVEIIGTDMEINISEVNELEKSKNGKHRLVISKL